MTDLLSLDALVGNNPAGFLAGLGCLDVASRLLPDRTVTLSWRDGMHPSAELSGPDDLEHLIDLILTDGQRWAKSVVLRGPKGTDPDDLKPDPSEVRAWFETAEASEHPEDLILLHALLSEGAVAGSSGDAKPTHLHFTAGQQKFLVMVRELNSTLTRDLILEAIQGPWRYESKLPVLGWDNSRGERLHALSARSPSGSKKLGVPGVDWLAFLGLRFVPVATTLSKRLLTTCCQPAWKTGGAFTWPLWNSALSSTYIQSLMSVDTTVGGRPPEVVRQVLRAPIRRADQGGYGSFGPTSPVMSG